MIVKRAPIKRRRLKDMGFAGKPMILDSFTYDCPCGTKIEVKPINAIVRSVEVYCKDCGEYHSLINPVFSANAILDT